MACSVCEVASHVHCRSNSNRGDRVITFFVLTDRPEQAKFLTAEERNWLVTTIAADAAPRRRCANSHWAGSLQSQGTAPGIELSRHRHRQPGHVDFHSAKIKSLGDYSNMTVGWLTMIPYTCGAIAMVVWGASRIA